MLGYIKDINEEFRKDLNKVIDDTLFEPTKEESIDYFNEFVGKVVDNKDPDKLGACKIRVFGLFSNKISDSDLPWFLPQFNFIGSKKGSFIVPPVGTIVNVFFYKGDIYQGFYTSKAVDKNNMPSQRNIDYPDNMVMWETDEGDFLAINRKSKETTFNHNSGTKITIKKDGSIEIDSNSKIDIKHKNLLTVEGKAVIPEATGQGCLCALPFCLYTGTSQVGKVCVP